MARTITLSIGANLGCLECPFYFVAEDGCGNCEELYCYHPFWRDKRLYESRQIDRAVDMRKPRMRPTWCPLETRPVLVTLGTKERNRG